MEAAALQTARNQIVSALAEVGYEVLSTDKLFLLSNLSRLSATTVAAVVEAVASQLTGGGLAGLAKGEIKQTLIIAVPSLQTIASSDEQAAFEDLCSYLSYLVKKG